ncbi:sensor histidine kinase [Azospirillum sp. B510]|uniref:sensor histidine kinase n=1 Tax=Azospirillum sp. (strain B510) TaxID=137722 RepID=UPI0002EFF286|nr:HAMP domain-containing sensor histidine kinase [Azospirillum sp. B510]
MERVHSLFGTITLRWRLVIAFLSVSAFPVLIASLVVADLVSGLFSENLERWLQDAAMFVTQRAVDEQGETRQAAGVVAASLAKEAGVIDEKLVEISAGLLTSVGYDSVAIYRDDGTILFSRGLLGDGKWLPHRQRSRFFVVDDHGRKILLLGSARRFQHDGQTYFVFVGDRWDGTMINIAGVSQSLRIQVYAIADGKGAFVTAGSDKQAELPPVVVEKLTAGAPGAIAKLFPSDNFATGFAALRDTDGGLMGVVVCRMSDQIAMMSHVRTLELFVLLVVVAGGISLVVALSLSALISRPLNSLTQALRRVHEGDYSTRVPVQGGRELEQLAVGFNSMTGQLDTLRRREDMVRRREKLAILGEAAAVIAHEIRNPLGIIKTSSQVLRMKSQPPEASDRLIGFVLDEVGRMEALVQELLDYARPKAAMRQVVDLGAELRNVLEFIAAEMFRRRVLPKVELPDGPLPVQGDPSQLHQALLNILLNAMEAMPDGGALSVTALREGDEVAVSIADTGVGIPEDLRDRVFEPFVTTKRRGTGLGLARVQDIMERHGGSVHFVSAPAVGSTFILRLPLMSEMEEERS